MKPFTIGGLSFVPELWKPGKNLKKILTYIDEAADKGAQVIATFEGAVDGYVTRDLKKHRINDVHRHTKGFKTRAKAFHKRQVALAKEIKETCIPALREKAKERSVFLFPNTLDLRRKTSIYNTTFVIDPKGKVIGKYDKIHAFFETGNCIGKSYPVFETPWAPIGVQICADRQFPESVRSVAANGARVLIANAYGMSGQGAAERIIRQRAFENGMYLLFCHPNETVLVSPEGRIIGATCAWERTYVRKIDPEQTIGLGEFGGREMHKTYTIAQTAKAYEERFQQFQVRKRKSILGK